MYVSEAVKRDFLVVSIKGVGGVNEIKSYDVFIDIHKNMQRISPLLNHNCIKVLHTL